MGTLVSVMHSVLTDRMRQFELRAMLEAEQQVQQDLRRARRRAEESEARLQAVFNSISEGVILQGGDGSLMMMNSVGLRLNGLEPALGIPDTFQHPAQLEDTYQLRTLEGEEVPFDEWPAVKAQRFEPFTDYEVEITDRTTGRHWIGRFNGRPIESNPGNEPIFVTSLQDITRQKETERALQDLTTTLEHRVQKRTQQIRRLTLALTQAEQQERQRISQFLHDDLQQILYGLQMRLHLLHLGLPPRQYPANS